MDCPRCATGQGHHNGQGPGFGCKVRTLSLAGDSTFKQSKRANGADIDAYNRMARKGEAPAEVTGASKVEWG